MITGDHPGTAAAIASELGIVEPGANAATGVRLQRWMTTNCSRPSAAFPVYRVSAPSTSSESSAALQRDGQRRRHDR